MKLQLSEISVDVTDGTEERTILDRLDLQVGAGEVVAITGESGSGKSTLIAVAGLLRPPDSGSVIVDGIDTTAPGTGERLRTEVRRSRIGLVFQSSNLFPSLDAVEQLELVAHIDGKLDGAARKRAEELLERVGMTERSHQRPSKLSGGERQRVALARALMNEPAVILADEPTASLDASRGHEIMALLAETAHTSGTATVIVTHAPDQLAQVDRQLHLENGRLVEV